MRNSKSETELFYPTEFFVRRYKGVHSEAHDLPKGSECQMCGRQNADKGLAANIVFKDKKSFTDQRRGAPRSEWICHFCATTIDKDVLRKGSWFVPLKGEAANPPKGDSQAQWWIDTLLNPPDEPFLLCRTIGKNAKHILFSAVVSSGGPFYHVSIQDRPYAVDVEEVKSILRLAIEAILEFGGRTKEKKYAWGFCNSVKHALFTGDLTYIKRIHHDTFREVISGKGTPLPHQDIWPVVDMLISDIAKVGVKKFKI